MLIHCTMDDLLALQDGTGRAEARRHVESCAACAAELERLDQRIARLRAVPALRPPRDRWAAVRDTYREERGRLRWLRSAWGAVAVAAIVVLAFGARTAAEQQQLARREQALNALVQRSQLLQATIDSLDPSARVWSSREASAVVQLEDSLSAINQRLEGRVAQQPSQDLINLWRQRVQLMDAIVGVHVSRASYVGS